MSSLDESELRAQLRGLRVDSPDAGFSMALHRKLVAAGPPDALPFWRRAPAARSFWPAVGALAACLAIALAVVSFQTPASTAAQLPATKVAVVRVNLTAEVAVQDARIRINLPEGLVFWSDGQELAQRSFEWTQPLLAGDNDIPIAVRGLRPGRYRMTVSAQVGGQQVDEDVVLEVTDG